MKIFCLPYAGGSSDIIFSKWKKYHHDIIPLEIPGRGSLIKMNACTNINELTNHYIQMIKSYIDTNEEYVIFGHSMGGLIGYVLTQKIELENYLINPKKLVISSKNSPDYFEINTQKFSNSNQVKSYLKNLRQPIIENEEYLNHIKENLNIDFKILGTIDSNNIKNNINTPIIYMGGTNDHVSTNYTNWKHYTNKEFFAYTFEGGHFYIENNIPKIINLIIHQ